LEGVERPIVLCAKKSNAAGLARSIAPHMPTFGIMLPYTPLHHLLFSDNRLRALVMTSGNITDEPIAFDNDDALVRIGHVADAFLIHNRDIYVRNDDSIVRIAAGGPVMQRRSRGFVPDPLDALHDVHGIVALGGVLKSTVAIGRKHMCYLSQYIGEVSNLETLDGLRRITKHLLHLLDVSPQLFIVDLHPESMTRLLADETGLRVVSAQHHHAHAVSCMAENELTKDAICIIYDGTGYGVDSCIWGGEILYATHTQFTRIGHLDYMPLPGADAAIMHPGRMAVAALFGRMGDRALAACPWMPEEEKRAVLDMVRSGVNCPKTSSMGRLFDATSALLGIGTRRTYEGQPAIELEGVADTNEMKGYEPLIIDLGDTLLIDGVDILFRVYEDFTKGTPREIVATRFHNAVARATALAAKRAADATGCARVCLSGGCFQNALLLDRSLKLLSEVGLQPFTHHRVPPNDECVSFGQLVIAGARREKEK
jgi:hydrogenase maturation protein HypF